MTTFGIKIGKFLPLLQVTDYLTAAFVKTRVGS